VRVTCAHIKMGRFVACPPLNDLEAAFSAVPESMSLVCHAGKTPNNRSASKAVPPVKSRTYLSGAGSRKNPE
jgi:hypothetical protein